MESTRLFDGVNVSVIVTEEGFLFNTWFNGVFRPTSIIDVLVLMCMDDDDFWLMRKSCLYESDYNI